MSTDDGSLAFAKKIGGRIKSTASVISTHVSSDDLLRSVLKATDPLFYHDDDNQQKHREKHIERVVESLKEDRVDEIIDKLRDRIRCYDWKAVMLALVLFHRIINDAKFGVAKVIATRGPMLFNMQRELKDLVSKPEDRTHVPALEQYGKYLEELCHAYKRTGVRVEITADIPGVNRLDECVRSVVAWTLQWEELMKIPILERYKDYGLHKVLTNDGIALNNNLCVVLGQLLLCITEKGEADEPPPECKEAMDRLKNCVENYETWTLAPKRDAKSGLKKIEVVVATYYTVFPEVSKQKLTDLLGHNLTFRKTPSPPPQEEKHEHPPVAHNTVPANPVVVTSNPQPKPDAFNSLFEESVPVPHTQQKSAPPTRSIEDDLFGPVTHQQPQVATVVAKPAMHDLDTLIATPKTSIDDIFGR